jgi:diguanylate cyclase (GGDEF)-like protein
LYSGVARINFITGVLSRHEGRLLVLATLICLFGSFVAVSVLRRAAVAKGRHVWIVLGAAAAGCCGWVTHFIAMLAGILGMCLVAALSEQRSERMLQQKHELFDAALENISQGLCMFDDKGCAILLNNRYAEMLGRPASSLLNSSLLQILRERKAAGLFTGDPDRFFARVSADSKAGKSNCRTLESPTGRMLRVVNQPTGDGGWVTTIEDVTDWRKAEERVAYISRHDPLTDLPNREHLQERLRAALQDLAPGDEIAVLHLDVDNFKNVNDAFGFATGDQLLVRIAQRLRECLDGQHFLARSGGDEFALVMSHAKHQSGLAAALAERLIEALSNPCQLGETEIVLGACVGAAVAPTDGADCDTLLKDAAIALHHAKAEGRGVVRFFEATMDAEVQERRILEIGLRKALAQDEFEIYYQPVVDIRTRRISGFEALLRWRHPERGMISPADFIPLAEETGAIIPIGEWVLRQACREAAGWSHAVNVAVNLSPLQFRDRDLVGVVAGALEDAGLSPGRLELEITETTLMQNSDETMEILRHLRRIGVRIAMDDFGTGYSSLGYLRRFPFDKIKIDQCFVRELGARKDVRAIVRAVTTLGEVLGVTTTAEGVETEEQLSLLSAKGCTEAQGYLFGRPQPASEVEAFLTRLSATSAAA